MGNRQISSKTMMNKSSKPIKYSRYFCCLKCFDNNSKVNITTLSDINSLQMPIL